MSEKKETFIVAAAVKQNVKCPLCDVSFAIEEFKSHVPNCDSIPIEELKLVPQKDVSGNHIVVENTKKKRIREKKFVCEMCTTQFTRNMELQRHINALHLKLKVG